MSLEGSFESWHLPSLCDLGRVHCPLIPTCTRQAPQCSHLYKVGAQLDKPRLLLTLALCGYPGGHPHPSAQTSSIPTSSCISPREKKKPHWVMEHGKGWQFLCEAAQGNLGALLQIPWGPALPWPRIQTTEQTTKAGRWKIPSGSLPRHPGWQLCQAGRAKAGSPGYQQAAWQPQGAGKGPVKVSPAQLPPTAQTQKLYSTQVDRQVGGGGWGNTWLFELLRSCTPEPRRLCQLLPLP